MACLADLPPELILEVAGWLKTTICARDLSSFAATNRYHYDVVTPVLYSKYGQRAVMWASQHGGIGILDKAACYSDNPESLVNPKCLFNAWEFHKADYDPVYRWTWEPLHLAAYHGHDDVVNWLLDRGADLEGRSQALCGCIYFADAVSPIWYPLHLALCAKRISTASLLLSRGAPLHINYYEDDEVVTALQSAARNGLATIVRQIRDRYQSEVKPTPCPAGGTSNSDGPKKGPVSPGGAHPTSLPATELDQIIIPAESQAAAEDDLSAESFESDSEFDYMVSGLFDLEPTLAHVWVSSNRYHDKYSRPPANFIGCDGRSAMHHAAFCTSFDDALAIAKDLILLNHDVDQDDDANLSPLDLACLIGNFTAARALLKAGATPKEEYDPENGPATLLLTLRSDYHPHRLQPHNLQPHEPSLTTDSLTAWHKSRLDFLIDLLRTSTTVNMSDGVETPLMVAARKGLVKECQLLVGVGGADVGYEDQNLESYPLESAAEACQLDTMRVLLDAGAQVNRRNLYGQTALYQAINGLKSGDPELRSREDCVRLLLAHGAKVGFGEDVDCSHHNLLQSQVKLASKFKPTFLGLLLQHGTGANIDEACWQGAAIEAFMTPSLQLDVYELLGDFGAKHRYALHDADIPPLIDRLTILDNNDHGLRKFFSLGNGLDDQIIRTKTGVITREFILVAALINCRPDQDDRLVNSLLSGLREVRGNIRHLRGNPTLLHLAAGSHFGDSRRVKALLDRGCEVDATNMFSVTPLAAAVPRGDLTVVQALLDAGANPFFEANSVDIEPADLIPVTSLDGDFLRPPRGMKLARVVPEYLAEVAPFTHIPEVCSPFTLAVQRGFNRMVQEFLRRSPSHLLVSCKRSTSCLSHALKNSDYRTAHQLLRAGFRLEDPEESAQILRILFMTMDRNGGASRYNEQRLAAIQHLLEIDVDAQLKPNATGKNAADYVQWILTMVNEKTKDLLSQWLFVKTDGLGRKIIKSRQRILDIWLLPV